MVFQDRCAAKVGTDSVLVGAWARGGGRVLDVGTGTGVVAMMMAQRCAGAVVDAVDIDEDACLQAGDNIGASPFAGRIRVHCMPVQEMAVMPEQQACYDAVVSNPPFFENALKAPAVARCRARHTDTLPFADLFASVRRMLTPEGEFSLIIPFDFRQRLETEAALAGFFPSRVCAVCTTPQKSPKRFLLAFRLSPPVAVEHSEGLLEVSPGVRSPWYQELTRDFYL